MSRRRVVITGIGVATPIGVGVPRFWNGILESRQGAGPISLFDATDFRTSIAMEVDDFNPSATIERKVLKLLDRYAQFAVVCSDEAIEDSGFSDPSLRENAGVIIGSGIGGISEIEEQHSVLCDRGHDRVSPFLIPKLMLNAGAGHIAIRHGLRGPNFSTASACASAQHALGVAWKEIALGEVDVILTGGSEATITPLAIAGFCQLKAMSTRNDEPETAMRPFQKSRDGFVMGEGGAILIFEELEHARRRGAKIYCEVLGFGMTDDAHHITAPLPDGSMAAESMRAALKSAGKDLTDVTYINAHGTSTPLNDIMESRAIRAVFGSHADKLMVSSTKSQIGHLLGASGAAELAAVAMGIANNVVPATINQVDPDPECDLDYVPGEPRESVIDVALSNSFGFGGHNACLCVGRFKD